MWNYVDFKEVIRYLSEHLSGRITRVSMGSIPSASILIADDDMELNKFLQRELVGYGFSVHSVVNGEEAISLMRDVHFDLAILDIRMPRVDGFEVLKVIKEEKPGMKVIMLTGYADLKNMIKSKEHGADAFMTKPYDIHELTTTIDAQLKR